MLKKVKYNFLKKYTNKNLKNRDVSQRNTPLKHLGFLVDETIFDDFEKLYEFGRVDLGLQQKSIKIFTFVKTRKKIPSLCQNQITNKEFTWRGEIHNQSAMEFLDFSFDVLVGFYNGKNEFMDAMVSQSKSKFKIGFNDTDSRLFDLLLATDLNNFDSFKNEVKKYLKILKKI